MNRTSSAQSAAEELEGVGAAPHVARDAAGHAHASASLVPVRLTRDWWYAVAGLGLGLLGAALYMRLDGTALPAGVAYWLGAFAGGFAGVAIVAWRARKRLRQAQRTAEGFRQRLMSIERNQAMWVSLSAVLHDVRNPLHNLILLNEGLAAPGADIARVRAQMQEELERIHVRLRNVTRQVMEFGGECDRRPVALNDILAEVRAMLAPLAQQAGIDLQLPTQLALTVEADRKFLVQAVDHLALNSLQILADRGRGRHNRLAIAVAQAPDHIDLFVEDNGPGLPDAVRNRPFEPLTQARPSGMGLGLAIAHGLCKAAGGELSVAHTGPNGTRFRFRLKPVGERA